VKPDLLKIGGKTPEPEEAKLLVKRSDPRVQKGAIVATVVLSPSSPFHTLCCTRKCWKEYVWSWKDFPFFWHNNYSQTKESWQIYGALKFRCISGAWKIQEGVFLSFRS